MKTDYRKIAKQVRVAYEANLGEVGAFLPDRIPLDHLSRPFDSYLDACTELPARYPAGKGGVRRWLDERFGCINEEASLAVTELTELERQRLMTALSVLAHTYRWDTVPPLSERFTERWITLPKGIDRPWGELASLLRQPRVGTTWSLHLCNWRMRSKPGGAPYVPTELTMENLQIAHQWLSGHTANDLERFSLAFVIMEAEGAGAIRALVAAIDCAARRHLRHTTDALDELQLAIKAMAQSFVNNVRQSHIDPAVWLEVIQPTFAWRVETDEGMLEGPSGMQLGTLQCLDAALDVPAESFLAKASRNARRYMPAQHRRFLGVIDTARPIIPTFVRESNSETLKRSFNECIRWLRMFRVAHARRGAKYLESGRSGDNARISTGLGISWRTNETKEAVGQNETISNNNDPIAHFKRTMAERTAETVEALITASSESAA